jgi:capsular polysaccharide biosynthesis protein
MNTFDIVFLVVGLAAYIGFVVLLSALDERVLDRRR